MRNEMLEQLLKHAAHKKKTASAGARTIATVAIATAATSMAAPAMAAEASPLDSLGDLGTTAEARAAEAALVQGAEALTMEASAHRDAGRSPRR